jgi:hypothetical protein
MGINYEQERRVIEGMGVILAYSLQYRSDTLYRTSTTMGIPINVSYLEIRRLTRTGWERIVSDPGYGNSGFFSGTRDSITPPKSMGGYNFDNYTGELTTGPSGISQSWTFRAPTETFPSSQRVNINQWLQWYRLSDTSQWSFNVADSSGHTIYTTRTLVFSGNPRNVFVTQNYPDKSIAIIWGSNGGVRATFLNQQLEPLAENVQVSTTTDSVSYPTGAYRNDTLFVAWEDYRNGGIPDVYGTAFTAPKASEVAVTGSSRKTMGAMTIAPNPAREIVRITLPEASSGVRVSVYDAMGRLRLQREISGEGIIAQELDVSGLPAGTYLARVTAKSGSFSSQFVVAR